MNHSDPACCGVAWHYLVLACVVRRRRRNAGLTSLNAGKQAASVNSLFTHSFEANRSPGRVVNATAVHSSKAKFGLLAGRVLTRSFTFSTSFRG